MSWIPPWRSTGPQWVAPLAKAPPTLPPSRPPPSPPPPPPPPGLTPQVRSEKRRKLQEHTGEFLYEPSMLNVSHLLTLQEECFQDYESCIQSLNEKLLIRDSCVYEQKQNINLLNRQLICKNNMLRKKNSDLLHIRSSCIQFQTQIENLTMQMMTDASEHEEKITHYKSLISGLQKTSGEAENSIQFINYIKDVLFNHGEGETLENSIKTADRFCAICMENKANIVCSPCMHMEYCSDCASRFHNLDLGVFVNSKRYDVNSSCPRCKQDVKELMYIFT